jgi:sugar O-acyltransferase (sialic acid O-acetyltransferase NeuD family)
VSNPAESATRTQPVPDIRRRDGHAPAAIKTREVIVVGAGGHGRELADIVQAIGAEDASVSLLGIVDDATADRLLLARCRFRFLGASESITQRDVDVHIGVGDPTARQRLDHRLDRPASPLIHPTATVGTASDLAAGTVLAQGVVVTTNVSIGRHTHVNVGASISHDCRLGSYVTVCPGVTLTGAVVVADRAFIGARATILPGISIGADAVIGAGAVVTKDVPAKTTVTGIPAR